MRQPDGNKSDITTKIWFDGVYWTTLAPGAQDRRDTEDGYHTLKACNAQNESLCDTKTIKMDACTEYTLDYVY